MVGSYSVQPRLERWKKGSLEGGKKPMHGGHGSVMADSVLILSENKTVDMTRLIHVVAPATLGL